MRGAHLSDKKLNDWIESLSGAYPCSMTIMPDEVDELRICLQELRDLREFKAAFSAALEQEKFIYADLRAKMERAAQSEIDHMSISEEGED